eukprot:1593396-Prymnesium_polylepis.1
MGRVSDGHGAPQVGVGRRPPAGGRCARVVGHRLAGVEQQAARVPHQGGPGALRPTDVAHAARAQGARAQGLLAAAAAEDDDAAVRDRRHQGAA